MSINDSPKGKTKNLLDACEDESTEKKENNMEQ